MSEWYSAWWQQVEAQPYSLQCGSTSMEVHGRLTNTSTTTRSSIWSAQTLHSCLHVGWRFHLKTQEEHTTQIKHGLSNWEETILLQPKLCLESHSRKVQPIFSEEVSRLQPISSCSGHGTALFTHGSKTNSSICGYTMTSHTNTSSY